MTKTPFQIAEERIGLAEEYSRYSGIFAECIRKQAQYFKDHRSEHNSDNATQKAFELTEDGVLMVTLKLKLKAIEKHLSATNTMLRLLENQAKNLY